MNNISYSEFIPSYCKKALKILNDNGYEAYAVGGAVRDIVMSRNPHDFDIATSADPDEIISVFKLCGIKSIDTARKHGTITVVIESNNVEITSFRTEGEYKDNRHPDSVLFTKSIKEDVSRRDFTMNALYLDFEGNVVDYNGGLEDIKDKSIRCVGEANKRFEEDALRIMRGLRFAAELGFSIDEATSDAMHKQKELLRNISGERIYTEFTKLIISPNAVNILREYVDVFAVFLPQLALIKGFDQHSKYHNLDVLEHTLAVLQEIPLVEGKRDEVLSYAALMHDIGKPDVFKMDEFGFGHMKGHALASIKIWEELSLLLKPSSKVCDEVKELIKYHDTYPEADKKAVHRFMIKHSVDFINKLHVLQRADILAHNEAAVPRYQLLTDIEELEKQILLERKPLARNDLKICGSDLVKLGIEPGKKMGLIIDNLLDEVIEDITPNSFEDLKKRALQMALEA